MSKEQREIEALYSDLESAETYTAWLAAAVRLDELENANDFKENPESAYYDHHLIQRRVDVFRKLLADGDIPGIVFRLRVGLTRNFGGVGHPQLYDKTHVGTKRLIEEHQTLLIKMLTVVCNAQESQLPLDKKINFFIEARHALGKTALFLSGGASLGMYHLGVVKSLSEQGVLPRIICGSSAGAVVAAIVAVRTSDELCLMFSTDETPEFVDHDPVGSLKRKIQRLLSTYHLMDVGKLQQSLRSNLERVGDGDITFHEAYERTGVILNITVSPHSDFEAPQLLNYLTSPTVVIWSAACA
eukprot:CAMPEP_0169450772 /NCGR_PEP_ID=MMETSP1042-20121227/13335_1 /TAXON_ID=464988 /ORGANISM="Hemiselmis andersenii, Strain CCMP1180" /LENGTH=299 /DNA_ID=CAMNT_0009562625 /DNA_START=109 /DNA_END=1004 /DNA_ORIENTATION=-